MTKLERKWQNFADRTFKFPLRAEFCAHWAYSVQWPRPDRSRYMNSLGWNRDSGDLLWSWWSSCFLQCVSCVFLESRALDSCHGNPLERSTVHPQKAFDISDLREDLLWEVSQPSTHLQFYSICYVILSYISGTCLQFQFQILTSYQVVTFVYFRSWNCSYQVIKATPVAQYTHVRRYSLIQLNQFLACFLDNSVSYTERSHINKIFEITEHMLRVTLGAISFPLILGDAVQN